jgi:glycosyltransferase involved in cell wall biosynthesis
MAQSCDRIVKGLRDAGLGIGLVHFRNTKSKEKFKIVKNGFELVFPVGDDEGHCYNLLYEYITNPCLGYKITHIVAFGGYLPILGAPIISKLSGLPLITMFRGNDLDLAIFSPKKREMLFYAINNSETVCTVSLEHKRKLARLTNHHNIKYIPNGINVEEWEPHLSELVRAKEWRNQFVSQHIKVIGVFGHLKAKKGIEFFIESIGRTGFSDKIFLLVTGETYPEIVQKMEHFGLKYHILPFLDRYELLTWYSVCDSVAIPSFYDGMPNVLLEAGALGIPVISSNTGGMKDVLSNNETGFMFHPGDIEACACAITRFINQDEESFKKMKERIKKHIINEYNSDIENENYLNLF